MKKLLVISITTILIFTMTVSIFAMVEPIGELELTDYTYYYENQEDSNPEGYFAPQNVLALMNEGEWYLISTSVGPKWIIPNIGPNSLLVNGDMLELTEDTYYYKEMIKENEEGYFGPQIVTILDVQGEWYQISTSVGPRWIIPNDGPNNISVETIELLEDTFYYTEMIREDSLGYFGPQTVTVLDRQGEWYLISTSVGPKWIIPNEGPGDVVLESQYLELLEDTYYYEEMERNNPLGYFDPQTVLVLDNINEWYQISTSVGPRWIIPNEGPGDVVLESQYIELIEDTYYYEESVKGNPLGYFGPQTVLVLENINEWYLISTSVGPRWIIPNEGPGDVEITEQTLELTMNTYYYEQMGKDNPLGYFNPQTVLVLENINEWYQISTSEGPRWVVPNEGPQDFEPANAYMELTSNTYYYDDIDGIQLGYFSPQNVLVISQEGQWYQISTSEGPRWILPNQGPNTIKINTYIYYYENINDTQELGYFSPQTFYFEEQVGDWYLINTSIGNKWISLNRVPDRIPGQIITLSRHTYYYLNAYDNNQIGYLAPQDVEIIDIDGEWFKISTSQGERWINLSNGFNLVELTNRTYFFESNTDVMPKGYLAPQSVKVINSEGNWLEIETWRGNRWINIEDNVGLPDVPAGQVMIHNGSYYEFYDKDILTNDFDLNSFVENKNELELVDGALYIPKTAGDIYLTKVPRGDEVITWVIPDDIFIDSNLLFETNNKFEMISLNGDIRMFEGNRIDGSNGNKRPDGIEIRALNGYLKLNGVSIESQDKYDYGIMLYGNEFVKVEYASIISNGKGPVNIVSMGDIGAKEAYIETKSNKQFIMLYAMDEIDVTNSIIKSSDSLNLLSSGNIYADGAYFRTMYKENEMVFESRIEATLFVEGTIFETEKRSVGPITNMIVAPDERLFDFVDDDKDDEDDDDEKVKSKKNK